MDVAELVSALLGMPNVIAHADSLVAHWKREVSRLQTEADALESQFLVSRSAKEWGANAGERKVNQAIALQGNSRYMEIIRFWDKAKHELALAEVEAVQQRNKFSAYRTVAELMAADRLGDRTVTSAANGHRIYSEVGL